MFTSEIPLLHLLGPNIAATQTSRASVAPAAMALEGGEWVGYVHGQMPCCRSVGYVHGGAYSYVKRFVACWGHHHLKILQVFIWFCPGVAWGFRHVCGCVRCHMFDGAAQWKDHRRPLTNLALSHGRCFYVPNPSDHYLLVAATETATSANSTRPYICRALPCRCFGQLSSCIGCPSSKLA